MLRNYTTAELGLMLLKHSEGRVILPRKIRDEVEQEITHRAASKGNA